MGIKFRQTSADVSAIERAMRHALCREREMTMRERHALWPSTGAGGQKDQRRVVRASLVNGRRPWQNWATPLQGA